MSGKAKEDAERQCAVRRNAAKRARRAASKAIAVHDQESNDYFDRMDELNLTLEEYDAFREWCDRNNASMDKESCLEWSESNDDGGGAKIRFDRDVDQAAARCSLSPPPTLPLPSPAPLAVPEIPEVLWYQHSECGSWSLGTRWDVKLATHAGGVCAEMPFTGDAAEAAVFFAIDGTAAIRRRWTARVCGSESRGACRVLRLQTLTQTIPTETISVLIAISSLWTMLRHHTQQLQQ